MFHPPFHRAASKRPLDAANEELFDSDELKNGHTSPISSVVSDRWRWLIRVIVCEVFVPVFFCVEGIAAHWTFEIVFGSVFVRHIRSTYPERNKYLRAEVPSHLCHD